MFSFHHSDDKAITSFRLFVAVHYGSWFDHVKGWLAATAAVNNLLHVTYEDMSLVNERRCLCVQVLKMLRYLVSQGDGLWQVFKAGGELRLVCDHAGPARCHEEGQFFSTLPVGRGRAEQLWETLQLQQHEDKPHG